MAKEQPAKAATKAKAPEAAPNQSQHPGHIETVQMVKNGAKVTVNKADVPVWEKNGYKTEAKAPASETPPSGTGEGTQPPPTA